MLDVGGGSGWLSRHVSVDRYMLLDVSTAPNSFSGWRLVADLSAGLPLVDGVADSVVAKDFLEHLASPLPVAKELLRVLRPGGVLYASVPAPSRAVWDDYTHVRPFTRRGLTRLLEDAGFRTSRVWVESVFPGSGRMAKRTGFRPAPFKLLASAGVGARNVVCLAERPG